MDITIARFVTGTLGSMLWCSIASATSPKLPQDTDAQLPEAYQSPATPSYQEPTGPRFDLPLVPEVSPSAPLSEGPRIRISAFRFVGNTVFTEAELQAVGEPFLSRYGTIEQLHALRQLLTLHYIKAGYVNSGALLPDQSIKDGVITYQLVEGVLDDVRLSGLKRLRVDYLTSRIQRHVDTPLNVQSLQDGLLLLQDNPLIQTVRAQLHPSEEPGHADLTIDVTEARPYSVSLVVDNHRSPAVGTNQSTLGLLHRNLTGFGDTLSGNYSLTKGANQYWASYAFPLTAMDTTLRAYYIRGESQVIETGFASLDIENETNSSGVELTQPIYRSPQSEVLLGTRLEHKKTQTSLLKFPFSFTPGVVNGESKVTHLDLFGRWRYRDGVKAWVAQWTLILGRDWFGASSHDKLPDSNYVAVSGQVQAAWSIGNAEFIGRTQLRWTDDRLLSSEKATVGGFYTVRGYREGTLAGDRSANVTIEYRRPLGFSDRPKHRLQGAIFADGGWVDNIGTSLPSPDTIGSIGIGVLYNYKESFHVTAYLSHQLRNVDVSDEKLVDQGVDIEVGLRW